MSASTKLDWPIFGKDGVKDTLKKDYLIIECSQRYKPSAHNDKYFVAKQQHLSVYVTINT